MIRVRIERLRADRFIRSVFVDGHAGFAESGKDIVCAGVSAITVGTVNAVKSLVDVELGHEMNKGLLHLTVPPSLDDDKRRNVQLLLESMVVMLDTVKASYGKYISIQEIII
jgi:uncharacterized protein YsxB (DUF464 family)